MWYVKLDFYTVLVCDTTRETTGTTHDIEMIMHWWRVTWIMTMRDMEQGQTIINYILPNNWHWQQILQSTWYTELQPFLVEETSPLHGLRILCRWCCGRFPFHVPHGTKQTTGGSDCAMNPIQHSGQQEWHIEAGVMLLSCRGRGCGFTMNAKSQIHRFANLIFSPSMP